MTHHYDSSVSGYILDSFEGISTRRIVFTPSVDVKDELKNTSIQITCLDEDGNVPKVKKGGKNYEEGYLEDRHSADCVNPDGSTDCPWYYELHGSRPTRILNRNLLDTINPQSP